jgi:HEAT repeat protein
VSILARRRPLSDADEFVRALADAADYGDAVEAAKALFDVAPRRQLPALEALVTESPKPFVRAFAIYAISWRNVAAAGDVLLRALADPDAIVRDHAAEAMGMLDGYTDRRRFVKPLLAAFDDPSSEVRYSIAYALGTLGDPRALPKLEAVAADDFAQTRYLTQSGKPSTVADEARWAIDHIREHSAQ